MVFPYYNIDFKEGLLDESIIVTGEIENNSTRDYSVAMFRVVVFDRKQVMGTGFAKVYEFKKNTRKAFEAAVKEMNYKSIRSISRCEILFESGY